MSAREKITVDVPNTGASWVTVEVPDRPARYKIYRARACLVSGTATEVAMKVSETEAGESYSTVLEYALTTDFIDAEEPGWLFVASTNVKNGKGSTWIACKADTTNNTFRVILDIEPLT